MKNGIGELWYGSWKDYKKIKELYDIDVMVSICRFPPYRYYGSVEDTGVYDFRQLGPSAELHKWRKESMGSKKDIRGDTWTEYVGRYQTEIGTRLYNGLADKQYNRIVEWLYYGYDVCLLCTCAMGTPCHRYFLWSNIVRTHKIPLRGSDVKLDFPEHFLDNGKVTDKVWEDWAIDIFANENRIGEENKVMLVCPHVEMSAAYDRLIKSGIFAKDGAFLYLKDTALKLITKGDWER